MRDKEGVLGAEREVDPPSACRSPGCKDTGGVCCEAAEGTTEDTLSSLRDLGCHWSGRGQAGCGDKLKTPVPVLLSTSVSEGLESKPVGSTALGTQWVAWG